MNTPGFNSIKRVILFILCVKKLVWKHLYGMFCLAMLLYLLDKKKEVKREV